MAGCDLSPRPAEKINKGSCLLNETKPVTCKPPYLTVTQKRKPMTPELAQ